MLVPLNGLSATVLLIHRRLNATSAGRSGQPVITTAYRILLWKVNRMKKGRSVDPASISQPLTVRALAHSDSRTEIFGVQRMNLTMDQNQSLLPLVDGDTRPTLKMRLYRAPRKGGKRRKKKRRIGGQEQKMHIPFLRSIANGAGLRRRRREAGLRRPVIVQGILRRSFQKMLRVVYMVRVQRNQRRHRKEQQRMYLSTSFKTDHSKFIVFMRARLSLHEFSCNIMFDSIFCK